MRKGVNMISKLNRIGVALILFLILLGVLDGGSFSYEEIAAAILIGILAAIAIVVD